VDRLNETTYQTNEKNGHTHREVTDGRAEKEKVMMTATDVYDDMYRLN
jgi:hypothetical protein